MGTLPAISRMGGKAARGTVLGPPVREAHPRLSSRLPARAGGATAEQQGNHPPLQQLCLSPNLRLTKQEEQTLKSTLHTAIQGSVSAVRMRGPLSARAATAAKPIYLWQQHGQPMCPLLLRLSSSMAGNHCRLQAAARALVRHSQALVQTIALLCVAHQPLPGQKCVCFHTPLVVSDRGVCGPEMHRFTKDAPRCKLRAEGKMDRACC